MKAIISCERGLGKKLFPDAETFIPESDAVKAYTIAYHRGVRRGMFMLAMMQIAFMIGWKLF